MTFTPERFAESSGEGRAECLHRGLQKRGIYKIGFREEAESALAGSAQAEPSAMPPMPTNMRSGFPEWSMFSRSAISGFPEGLATCSSSSVPVFRNAQRQAVQREVDRSGSGVPGLVKER
jgi:hypothetical protein